MQRRDFLKIFSAGSVAALSTQLIWRPGANAEVVLLEDINASPRELAKSIQYMTTPPPDIHAWLEDFAQHEVVASTTPAPNMSQYLEKMRDFDSHDSKDVMLEPERYPLLVNTFKRLDRVQNLVGHGNFNIVSFDEMVSYGKQYASVGEFTPQELAFIDELFSEEASRYGFFGEKVTARLTEKVSDKDRVKVRGTGHFLFRGDSETFYQKLRKDMGSSIVLTSGIRSVVKQTHLFLAKTIQSKGNLSRASRSLAPPGHSFHGVGDFDVGKVGFGSRNFTADFAETPEFKKLVDLGYVNIRYPKNNLLGVRYEPWHIKVV
ncbi:MAG: M15 family metallopeptidase [Pseudomonadales bacterium]|nr:M15 family metallopeptidase [Pseudomonadales bacterium]